MPHLSPMHWIFTITIFLFMVLITISLTWWHQTPKFPQMTATNALPKFKWRW